MDTCESLIEAYDLPMSLFQDNNPAMNCDQIYDGLVLCVAAGVMRPPPVAQIINTTVAAEKRSEKKADFSKLDDRARAEDGENFSLDVDEQAWKATQARLTHGGGASRHSKGIRAPILKHHHL